MYYPSLWSPEQTGPSQLMKLEYFNHFWFKYSHLTLLHAKIFLQLFVWYSDRTFTLEIDECDDLNSKSNTLKVVVWIWPAGNLCINGSVFHLCSSEARMVSSSFICASPTWPSLPRLVEEKEIVMTDGPAGYLDICLLLHSPGRKRSGHRVTGLHNSMY